MKPSGRGGREPDNYSADTISELDPFDFSRLRSDRPFSREDGNTGVTDTGGDTNTIWMVRHIVDESPELYELDSEDFSIIRSSTVVPENASGIGGDSDTIWYTDYSNPEFIIEIETENLTEVRRVEHPGDSSGSIGGNKNVIWTTSSRTDVYEVDTSDLSTVREGDSRSEYAYTGGIGGDQSKMWYVSDGEVVTANYNG